MKSELEQRAVESDQCIEMRCRECLKLHEAESFASHECKGPEDFNRLRALRKERAHLKRPKAYTLFLNELQEMTSSTCLNNPEYMLHLMIQDKLGKIHGGGGGDTDGNS